MKKQKILSVDEGETMTPEDQRLIEINASIVEAIKAGMRVLRIDQTMLAKRLGASAPYVNKILTQKQNFSVSTLYKFSKALGLRLKIELSI